MSHVVGEVVELIVELQMLEEKALSTPVTPDPHTAISSLDNFNKIC